MPNERREPSIAIIGGSITGPALALLFHRAGLRDVDVYEATPETVPQAGGVIGLDHQSLSVLDTIGVPQDEIVPFPSERVVSIKVADRREAGRVQTLYPGRNTSWTLINRSLRDRLPLGTLHTGMRLTSVDIGADERAMLSFQDGYQRSADIVAFADGRRSTGRRLFDPRRRLRYAGYVAWRGQLPWCPPELRDFTRYEPGGSQFNLFPIIQADGSIATDWTFYLDHSAQEFRHLTGGDPTRRTFALPHQITEQARRLVERRAKDVLPPLGVEIIQSTSRWTTAPIVDIAPPARIVHTVGKSHAVLLGDALAPVRPHTGRGANNGLEQAAGLVTALGQHRRHGANLGAALHGWEARYLPQVGRTIEQGYRLGRDLGLGQHTAERIPA